jgi:nitrate reductase delta subunit
MKAAMRIESGRLCASLAPLLEYPGDSLIARAFECRHLIEGAVPDAAREIGRFLEWALNTPRETMEEVYTRSFYISPLCVPYAGVHLFGEEGYQRGALMARFKEAYDAAGYDGGEELPDHIGVLLGFAPRLDGEAFDELVRYCLREPVRRMARQLERAGSPYLHVLRAAQFVFEAVHSEGGSR